MAITSCFNGCMCFVLRQCSKEGVQQLWQCQLSVTFPLGGRLELRLEAWLNDLVEKLRVLVLEADRLLAFGLLVISSLLTADIFDWLLVLAGDCGALLDPGLALKLKLQIFPVGEDTDPARVRLRPVRGMVLSPFTPPPPPLRLPSLSREKHS